MMVHLDVAGSATTINSSTYASDRAILLREFSSGALPALQLRPLLAHLGIRVTFSGARTGIVTACAKSKTIRVGGQDDLSWRGPYAEDVRALTSALGWGFGHIRLSALGLQGEAAAFAGAFLCPLELLKLAPELPTLAKGVGLDELARRLAVAPWVVREALLGFNLLPRILQAAPDDLALPKHSKVRLETE